MSNLVPLTVLFAAASAVTLWVAGDVMSRFIFNVVLAQRNLAFGMGDGDMSLGSLVTGGTQVYLRHIQRFPHTFLLGDGFSKFGLMKGGDVGFIGTLARLGFPFYLAVLVGLATLIRRGVRQVGVVSSMRTGRAGGEGVHPDRMLQLAICITLLVLICDGHYSVWVAKAILPVIFFALALFGRYMPSRSRRVPAHSRRPTPLAPIDSRDVRTREPVSASSVAG